MCDLSIRLLAGDDDDSPTAQLDECGIVGRVATTGVCGTEHCGTKRLRGLHRHQCRARRSVDHDVVGVDQLDRVGHRDAGDGRVGAVAHRLDDSREQLQGRKRTGCVVHADDGCRVRDFDETGSNGFAARGTSGDATLDGRVGRWYDENDAIACRPSGVCGVIDDASRADLLVLLGATDPRTRPAGDHDGPDNLSCGERHDRRG